jgi:hypothetical protein
MRRVRAPRALTATLLIGVVLLPRPEVTEARLSDHVTIEGNQVGASWWEDAPGEATTELETIGRDIEGDPGDDEPMANVSRSGESTAVETTDGGEELEADAPEALRSDTEQPLDTDELSTSDPEPPEDTTLVDEAEPTRSETGVELGPEGAP